MLRKMSLMVGFGCGYVLGARAGRERYEEIMTRARALAGSPQVESAKESVIESASHLGESVVALAQETVEKITGDDEARDNDAARAAAELSDNGASPSASAPVSPAGAPLTRTRVIS